MSSINKRRLSYLAALIVVIGGFLISRQVANGRVAPEKEKPEAAVREAPVREVVPGDVQVSIPLQGRLVAFETVPLFAEVTGVFEASDHPFKVGVYYKKGDLLARLNSTEASLSLQAQKSTLANTLAQAMPELKIDYNVTFPAWDAYLRALDPGEDLAELPAVKDDAARFFLNAKDIYSQYYEIKASEDRLRKYTLRAPMSGTLTVVNATQGALVRSGQQLGTLTASRYELAATVPVNDLSYLSPGSVATLQGPQGNEFEAKVARISTQVDPNTQAATVYLSVRGEGLREGLYLRGEVAGAALADVLALDQRLLVGQNQVYVVNDGVLERADVQVVRRSGDVIYVRGLGQGTKLLAESLPGAYEGLEVKTREVKAETAAAGGSTTPAG